MRLNHSLHSLVWVVPAVLLIGIFIFYPLVSNAWLSFFTWSVFAPEHVFVGFDNFVRAFRDRSLYTALFNNVAYAAVSLLVQVGLGLVIAALLDRFATGRLQSIFRSIYFLPATLSITVVGVLFTFVYHPQVGLLNSALDAVGLGDLARTWLGDPQTAIWAIIAMSQWQWTGYVAALLLVAIQRIPKELYEAAALDGANGIRQFFNVTGPLTREMVAVMSIVTVSNAFLVFNEVIAMTNGGPNGATEVLATLVYRNAFANDDMGYAAAISTLILLVTLTFAAAQLTYTRMKRVSY